MVLRNEWVHALGRLELTDGHECPISDFIITRQRQPALPGLGVLGPTARSSVLRIPRLGLDQLQAAQPALLYIVPAVLAAVALHAWKRGEFTQVPPAPPSSS